MINYPEGTLEVLNEVARQLDTKIPERHIINDDGDTRVAVMMDNGAMFTYMLFDDGDVVFYINGKPIVASDTPGVKKEYVATAFVNAVNAMWNTISC